MRATEFIIERNNGWRWTGDEIFREIGDEDIDEGVIDWAKKGIAGAAIGAAALSPQVSTASIHSVQKPSIVQKHAPETFNTLSMNNTDAEVLLQKAAKQAGMKGTELAQFLAQARHESADFSRMKEIGGPNYYKKMYDPAHAPRTAKILGNKKVGDGEKYHGRGFFQITGRDNYRMAGEALNLPLEEKPALAERPDVAAKIAVWYWNTRVKPHVQNFNDTRAVTKKINPAGRGLADRQENFADYKRIV